MQSVDYSKLEREANKDVPKAGLADLSGVNAFAEYNTAKSATQNLEDFLADQVYAEPEADPKMPYHHALLLTRLIHEQCLTRGIKEGFNDFKEVIENQCAAMELSGGKLMFFNDKGVLLQEFDTEELMTAPVNSDSTADLLKVHKREIVTFTNRALTDLMPGFETKIKLPELPQIKKPGFRIPPNVFRETGNPPLLLDIKASGDESVICAGYVVEFVRYYFGTTFVHKYRFEGKDAWAIRNNFLKPDPAPNAKGLVAGEVPPPAVVVEASMNSLLHERDGKFEVQVTVQQDGSRETLYGDAAKGTAAYQDKFRNFLNKASHVPGFPPGMVTLYYHQTRANQKIIEANRAGNDAHNSHITMNLGESKKKLHFGMAPEATEANPEEKKKVSDIVWENFPNAKEDFAWMMIKEGSSDGSRVYLNGKALLFKDGELYVDDGSEEGTIAMAAGNDTIEWEDVYVADRFHSQNRVLGLCEMMMTGEYDLVDVMKWNPEAVPETVKDSPADMPFNAKEIFHLTAGQTLEGALIARGVEKKNMALHMYAYERLGINPLRLRPLDPIPLFDESSMREEIKKYGGLGGAIAELKMPRAALYNQEHPGEYMYIVGPRMMPDKLVAELLKLPEFAAIEKLTGEEKQWILQTILAANPQILLEINIRGGVAKVHKYNAGQTVYVNKELLDEIISRVNKKRAEGAVYIPDKLPGVKMAGLKPLLSVQFTKEEKQIIENASTDPNVRRTLTLILAMEQKQETGMVHRSKLKLLREAIANILPINIERLHIRSFGMFQVRLLGVEVASWAKENPQFEGMPMSEGMAAYGKILQEDPNENARVAAKRVGEILVNSADIYEAHGERFDGKTPGCIAFALNVYHAAEVNVLSNTFSVWASAFEKTFNVPAEYKTKLVGRGIDSVQVRVRHPIGTRFEKIVKVAREKFGADISDEEIAQGVKLISTDKIAFLRSDMLAKLEAAYTQESGKKLSLNISPELIQGPDISTAYLSYGLRAAQYGTLNAIELYSQQFRKTGPAGKPTELTQL